MIAFEKKFVSKEGGVLGCSPSNEHVLKRIHLEVEAGRVLKKGYISKTNFFEQLTDFNECCTSRS